MVNYYRKKSDLPSIFKDLTKPDRIEKMVDNFKPLFILLFLFKTNSVYVQLPDKSTYIIGKWISVQNNVIIEVSKDSGRYTGKVFWFRDWDDPGRPMKTRTDIYNPDTRLHNRKILGLQVLWGLIYNPKSNCWENGKVYDVKSGRTWSATLSIENDSTVKVRGYWHFEVIGKTMLFKRL